MVRHRILFAMLALAICTGLAQANVLAPTVTVGSALKCDTNTGTSGSVTIKLIAATATSGSNVLVGLPPPTGIAAVVSAGSATLTSSTASVTYTVTTLAGCAGASALGAWAPVLQFTSKVGKSVHHGQHHRCVLTADIVTQFSDDLLHRQYERVVHAWGSPGLLCLLIGHGRKLAGHRDQRSGLA